MFRAASQALRRLSRRCFPPVARCYAAVLAWRGRPEEAERVLARAAACAPRSFAAQLAWGRALLALGRENEARAAFRRCCGMSAARFLRRSELPAALREVVAMECVLDRAEDRPAPPRPSAAPFAGNTGLSLRAAVEPPPPGTDFASRSEALRFQGLPPIDKTAAKDVDWDDLLRKLARPPADGPEGPSGD